MPRAAPRPAPVPSADALDAQAHAFERARAALAHPRSTVVVTGTRGRGKSALLGRLHRELDAGGEPPLVTSALRGAIDSLERHARARVRFAAPEAALRAPPGTLLVDEAAALPASVLAGLLARHDRVVLATTVDGHEAAGRAFAVRLDALLGERCGRAARIGLDRPMRWASDDPVERLARRALLLDATGPTAPATGAAFAPAPGAVPDAAPVTASRLRADEALLRALVRLLSGTHYQSAPHDAEHLLAGSLDAWAARLDGRLVGVALVAREGGIDAALAPDVLAGRRRLPDQLLPQLLARAAGDGAALGARYARVVRVAVEARARRRGVGSALLRAIEAGGADATGACFAAEPDAVRFWLANGYRAFHAGRRVNPRSGRASVSVLRVAGDGASRDASGDAPGTPDAEARRLAGTIAANAARHGSRD